MRMSDWSSDVCSSELALDAALGIEDHRLPLREIIGRPARIAGASEADESIHHDIAHRLLCRRRVGHGAEAEADIVGVLRSLEIELGSEERRVGTECASTCKSRGSPSH